MTPALSGPFFNFFGARAHFFALKIPGFGFSGKFYISMDTFMSLFQHIFDPTTVQRLHFQSDKPFFTDFLAFYEFGGRIERYS